MSIDCKWDRSAQTITWTSDRTATTVVARLGEMDKEILERAMFHGLAARGTDATAMAMDHWDGKDKAKRYATDHEKLSRCKALIDHLNSAKGWDNWSMKRSAADPLAGKSQAELEALIALAQQRIASLGIIADDKAE